MTLEFSPRAESDLQEIGDWIAEDNPVRAVTFLHELEAAALRIVSNPLLYRLRPEVSVEAPHGHRS